MFKKIPLLLIVLSACSPSEKESKEPLPIVTGLDGKQYFEPQRSAASQAKLDSNLNVAQKNFEADPSEDNYVWLGRRLGYLYRYDDAIKTFTEGLEKYPSSYKLFRHRGHRYISLRNFGKAIADLQMAASIMPRQPLEIEPDGQPNKMNIPLSSVQFNIWYHLALAHYLQGDFESAEQGYLECLDVSDNDDLLCATADWLYMTYRRMDRADHAAKVLDLIHEDMKIIENDSYYLRLQMYKGMLPADDLLKVSADNTDVDLALATQGYGVGNWYLCEKDSARAVEIFKQVTAGKHFAAFGFIAAEADLHRMKPIQ